MANTEWEKKTGTLVSGSFNLTDNIGSKTVSISKEIRNPKVTMTCSGVNNTRTWSGHMSASFGGEQIFYGTTAPNSGGNGASGTIQISDDVVYNTSLTFNFSGSGGITTGTVTYNISEWEELVGHQITTQVNPVGYGTTTGDGIYAQGENVTLVATPSTHKRFVNWTLNGVEVSTNPTYTFTMGNQTQTYVANFEDAPIVNVNISVSPDDSGIVQKSEDIVYAGDDLTLTAIANNGYRFSHWSTGETTNVITIYNIQSDLTIVAYFDELLKINISTSPSGIGSVWQSPEVVFKGDDLTLKARDEEGYRFSHWSTGATTQTITINNIQTDLTIVAYYIPLAVDYTNHQFRAYIKDKMAINTLPKAFIEVESFVIRRDLLTSTKSEINAYEMPTNINEGDIIVVYDSKGHVLYHGVIDQISDTKLNCNQIQNFYEGTWVCDNYPTTSIEAEISYLLGQYASGNQKGSTWQDTLIYQELAPIKITTGSTTAGQLETFEENATMDFEEFIYSLYSKYNLIFDFTIPYNSWDIGDNDGKVEIRKPLQDTILIGDNTDVIQSISPTTEIEQTNKLIVYANDGTYRTTYVYKTGSGIVVEPSSQIGRLAKVNTAVVFSDDSLDDIKEANITAEMFNHQISFNIEAKNRLYDFWSWELGQPIKIWQGNNYFDSVFTGYEISCGNGQEIGLIKVICGKVRTKLTSLLKMGVAR